MSASESRSAIATWRGTLLKVGTAVLVVWALSAAIGRLISPLWATVTFVGLAAFSVAVTRVGEFSVPFALSVVGVVAIVLAALQEVASVGPFIREAFGLDLAGVNLWLLAFYAFVVIGVIWVVDIRVTSAFRRDSGRPQASNPDTVARAFQRRASRLFDDWRGVVAAAVFIGFLLLQAAFGLVGDVGGQVLAEIGQVPVVSGFAAFIPFVYANMGGNLPLVSGLPLFGTLTAGEVAIVGVLVLLLAYFSREAE